jgi:hypothetical protein
MEAVMEKPLAMDLTAKLSASIKALRESPNCIGDCDWCGGPIMSHSQYENHDGALCHCTCKRRSKLGNGEWNIDYGEPMRVIADRYDSHLLITRGAARMYICGIQEMYALRDALASAIEEQNIYDEVQRRKGNDDE